jgi:Lysyl oxidase
MNTGSMRRMTILALIIVLSLLPPPIIAVYAQDKVDEPVLLLPDLRTLPPADIDILSYPSGTRVLRLDNTIWNSGNGPLELMGQYNRLSKKTQVWQKIATLDSTPIERVVGEFVFHPGHSHWHFEEFALYQLWRVSEFGGLDEVVATSDKLSYCLLDTDIIDRNLPDFARWGQFYTCGQANQGLSVGWGDTYDSFLDGQSLDITELPDGLYALVSTTNPEGRILETDYTNNAGITFIQIAGDQVSTTLSPELSHETCRKKGQC